MNIKSLVTPSKYYNKTLSLYEQARLANACRNYSQKQFVDETRAKYQSLGLDYDAAIIRRNDVLDQTDQLGPIDKNTSCQSEHWTLFSAINLVQPQIKRILEIGTYNAETTHFLSRLFPDAHIITVDLPSDDPIFVNSYGRKDAEYRQQFLDRRTRLLDADHITFIEKNSFLLPSLHLEKFDMVWVDACHEFPEVAWDTCNAYHLLHTGGWLLCDDIYMQKKPPRGETNAAYATIKALKDMGIISLEFIVKRLTAEGTADANIRKHIAVGKKLN